MILIDINMPNDCYECPCHDGVYDVCKLSGKYHLDGEIPKKLSIKGSGRRHFHEIKKMRLFKITVYTYETNNDLEQISPQRVYDRDGDELIPIGYVTQIECESYGYDSFMRLHWFRSGSHDIIVRDENFWKMEVL